MPPRGREESQSLERLPVVADSEIPPDPVLPGGMRRGRGELYELVTRPTDPRLYNADLAPTLIADRTWTTYNVASLWVGLAVCIPTYMLAASLVGGGMSWRQALFTITLGNLIVCVPMVLVAHAGTRFGIPFPVLARASFGVFGSNVPAMLRAVVACGWFGIQTWIGGQAIYTMLRVALPHWEPPHALALGFAVFWLWNMYIVVRGSNSIKALEAWAAPFLIVAGIALLAWATNRAGGVGPVLAQPSRFRTTGEFLTFFVPSLTAMVGFWATVALNIPDLSRYARDQRAQIWGQFLGLPTTMALFSFIGVAVTSASVIIFGEPIWDPVKLLSRLESPALILVALFALLIATLTTNVAANVVAPANGFANLWPSRINFARGGVITGLIGIVIMPWRLLENADRYIGWLITYSAFLGPIAGIFIADYWVVRRTRLSLADLYAADGLYGRWNPRALAALAAGVAVALVGLVVPALRVLFDYAWFVGFGVAFAAYMLLMRQVRQVDLGDVGD
jgi:NCS1 family nucleobase:cation symporter-1